MIDEVNKSRDDFLKEHHELKSHIDNINTKKINAKKDSESFFSLGVDRLLTLLKRK